MFYSKIQLLLSIYFAGDKSQPSSSSSDTSSSPNNGMEDEIISSDPVVIPLGVILFYFLERARVGLYVILKSLH